MVRKIQKAKTSSLKPSSSKQKASTKAKKSEKLTNGYGDLDDKTENKVIVLTESETPQPTEDDSEMQRDVQMSDPIAPSETTNTSESSRKRKIPVPAVVEETTDTEKQGKTKSKRQKVLLEIPKISTVPGKLFVIGQNDVGQLGLGEDITEKARPALLELPHSIVDIAAGGMHSVCLTESGEVLTFGCNDEGALGRITTEEDGSEYTPRKVDIPERIVQVSAGDSHSAALSDSGQVYIWGNFRNGNGSMGLVKIETVQKTPVKILTDVTVVKIASGNDHLVCLSQEGVAYTCGRGESGQLGRVHEFAAEDGGRKGRMLLLSPDKVSISISERTGFIDNIWTGCYSTFLKAKETGLIYAFGLNNYNQLGFEGRNKIYKPKHVPSFNIKTWQHINGGMHHTLALDNAGLVYSFGRPEYGRLGLGENSDIVSVPTAIPLLKDKKCIDISSGDCVSFAVEDDGNVFSWGMGTSQQLGHGDDSDRNLPQLIQGNFLKAWKAFKVSGGGQHTLILAHPRALNESQ